MTWTPAQLGSKLSAWWDPSDALTVTLVGGNEVSDLADKSGQARHLAAPTTARRPFLESAGLGGRACLSNVGRLQAGLRRLSVPVAAVRSVWLSYQYVDSASAGLTGPFEHRDNYSYLIDANARAVILEEINWNSWGTAFPNDSTRYQPAVVGGALRPGGANTVTLCVNGSVNSFTPTTPAATAGQSYELSIVGFISDFFNRANRVGEVVVLNDAPTVDERQRLEGYLAHRWGAAGRLPTGHPWKLTPPTLPSQAGTAAVVAAGLAVAAAGRRVTASSQVNGVAVVSATGRAQRPGVAAAAAAALTTAAGRSGRPGVAAVQGAAAAAGVGGRRVSGVAVVQGGAATSAAAAARRAGAATVSASAAGSGAAGSVRRGASQVAAAASVAAVARRTVHGSSHVQALSQSGASASARRGGTAAVACGATAAAGAGLARPASASVSGGAVAQGVATPSGGAGQAVASASASASALKRAPGAAALIAASVALATSTAKRPSAVAALSQVAVQATSRAARAGSAAVGGAATVVALSGGGAGAAVTASAAIVAQCGRLAPGFAVSGGQSETAAASLARRPAEGGALAHAVGAGAASLRAAGSSAVGAGASVLARCGRLAPGSAAVTGTSLVGFAVYTLPLRRVSVVGAWRPNAPVQAQRRTTVSLKGVYP